VKPSATAFGVFADKLLVHTGAMRLAELFRSVLQRILCLCRGIGWTAAKSALALLVAGTALGQETPAKPWNAGAYSFSDELGGFRIVGISGAGTREDPIVIQEEMNSATPVTMVIRTVRPIRPFDYSGLYANGFMHLRIEVLNNSKLPWIEFEFELQEQLGKASVFGDGLSFDQRRTDSGNISSQSFSEYSRAFEPYDRLLFREGKVDYLDGASFLFMITDFTPRWEFYLVQDPRIPSS
jgi:hypothetical protein